MENPYEDVIASYHRCRSDDSFIDTFYDLFLAKSPEIAPKFSHTDFSRQKRVLRQSVLLMLSLDLDVNGARDEIIQLGHRHGRHELDIRPALYGLWMDALCEAVALHDPKYQPELDKRWRDAMRPGIELIISLY